MSHKKLPYDDALDDLKTAKEILRLDVPEAMLGTGLDRRTFSILWKTDKARYGVTGPHLTLFAIFDNTELVEAVASLLEGVGYEVVDKYPTARN